MHVAVAALQLSHVANSGNYNSATSVQAEHVPTTSRGHFSSEILHLLLTPDNPDFSVETRPK